MLRLRCFVRIQRHTTSPNTSVTLRSALAILLIASIFVAPFSTYANSSRTRAVFLPSTFGAAGNYLGMLVAQLTQTIAPQQGSPGMPVNAQPPPRIFAPQPPPSASELIARVAQLTLTNGSVVQMVSQQPMNFTALPLDTSGEVVQGIAAVWSSSDNNVIYVSKRGQAIAGNPGAAILTAQIGTILATTTVVVNAGTGERFGGRKPISTSVEQQTPTAGATRTKKNARIVKAVWSPDENVTSNERERTKGANVAKFAPAMTLLRPIEDDPLPDDDTMSLYSGPNTIGAPPGKVQAGAMMAAAATGGTERPGSSNFSFGVPIVDLPGRQMNLSMALAYNSRVWNKSTNGSTTRMTYDADSGWPAPGFRLGFGQMEDQGTGGFTLTDSDGTRHEMRATTSQNYFESVDGTFIKFYGGRGWGTVTYSDGTRVEYGAAGTMTQNNQTVSGFRSYPTLITDRNGNYMLISYSNGVGPQIASISDTVNHYITFHYTGDDLITIKVPGYAGGAARQTVRFYYEDLTLGSPSASFQGMTVNAPTTARVIRYIYFPGAQSGYRYDYSSYGMIYDTKQLRGMTVSTTSDTQTGAITSEGSIAAQTTYNYPTTPSALTDAPTYTQRTDDWAGRTSAQPTYTFSIDQAAGTSTITAPDGTITENQTIVNAGAWNDGLLSETTITLNNNVLAKTHIDWEHDGTTPGNPRNQRPSQILYTDEAGQTRGTVLSYTAFNNVATASERDFGATTGTIGSELRRTETTYQTGTQWTSRNLVHLPTSVKVYAAGAATPTSRVDYTYDTAGTNLMSREASATQRDISFEV